MRSVKLSVPTTSQPYLEQSQLILKSYSAPPPISLSIPLDRMLKWMQQVPQRPLLITSPQYSGTKTLLCEFIKMVKRIYPGCLVISMFSTATPYYAEIIYKITKELRVGLGLNQKVELSEEKLRQYFGYWLELADAKIEREYIGYSQREKRKVIVIVEGGERVVDGRGQLVGAEFWVPGMGNCRNVGMVVTMRRDDRSVGVLQGRGWERMEFGISGDRVEELKGTLRSGNVKMANFASQVHFGDLVIAKKLLDTNRKMELQQENLTFEQFLIKFVEYVSGFLVSEQIVYKLLGCLIWSKKGVSKNTLKRSLKVKLAIIEHFIEIFKEVILDNDDAYLITDTRLKGCIVKIIGDKLGNPQQTKKNIHSMLAKGLKRQPNSLTNLEESIHHLQQSSNFTELEQLLSRIDNFLLLYTPATKHLLCMCWLQLETHHQYDPVFEYNRSAEKFLHHYYPSPEDTFRVVFQLSLFFKEYSEFENTKTPVFRHPPIRGDAEQFEKIGMLEELIAMRMHQKCKVRVKETMEESLGRVKAKTEDEAVEGTKEVEKLNVNIKSHQDKFRSFYLLELKPYIDGFYTVNSNIGESDSNSIKLLDQDEQDSETQFDDSKTDIQKLKLNLFTKEYVDYCEQQYNRDTFHQHSFYYYKQWIWMQFPWICQSITHNYSTLINKYMKCPTEYMPLEMEAKLVRDALRIARYTTSRKQRSEAKGVCDRDGNQERCSVPILDAAKMQIQSECATPNQRQRLSVRTFRSSNNSKNPQFDLLNIDEELKNNPSSTLQFRPVALQPSSIFMTNISLAQSQLYRSSQKQNFLSRFRKCPYLSPSVPSTPCELPTVRQCEADITETRDYGLLVTKHDEVKFENDQLVERIRKVQRNREVIRNNNKEGERERLKGQIGVLRERGVRIGKCAGEQQALKATLERIIKLCDINQSHGSESADLNGFLGSLKMMVRVEQSNLEDIDHSIKKIIENGKAQYKKLKQTKQNAVSKLKLSKIKHNKQLLYVPPSLPSTKPPKPSLRKQKKQTIYDNTSVKICKLEHQLQELNSSLAMFAQQLGLIPDEYGDNGLILQQLSEKVDKLNEVSWKLNELIDENIRKENRVTELEEKVSISKGRREHERHVNIRGMECAASLTLQVAEERLRCLEQCFELVGERKG